MHVDTHGPCSHHHDVDSSGAVVPTQEANGQVVANMLGNVFGSAQLETSPLPVSHHRLEFSCCSLTACRMQSVLVKVDNSSARVFLDRFDVICEDGDGDLRVAVEPVASRAHAAVYPIARVQTVEELMEEYDQTDTNTAVA